MVNSEVLEFTSFLGEVEEPNRHILVPLAAEERSLVAACLDVPSTVEGCKLDYPSVLVP